MCLDVLKGRIRGAGALNAWSSRDQVISKALLSKEESNAQNTFMYLPLFLHEAVQMERAC